jgi:hypothetical protein
MSSVTSFGASVRKTPSAALCHSWMVVKWRKDSLLLILPHKELFELVRSGLRGGDVNGDKNVGQPRPKQRPGKRYVQNFAHRNCKVYVCPIVRFLCLWAEVWAMRSTWPNKMPFSRVHREVRSSQVIWCHTITCCGAYSSYCIKWGYSFDHNTIFLSLAHSSLKRTFVRHILLRNVPSRAWHESQRRSKSATKTYSRKSGRYSLAFKSFFLWSRTVGRSTPILDYYLRVDFTGERWMELTTTE